MANMVDQMLASVSGTDEVGYDEIAGMDDADVGALVKARAARGGRPAARQAPARHQRSSRDVPRRAAAGFPTFTLAAVIGATSTQVIKASRVVDIDRLLLVASIANSGAVVDAVKVGDEEQLLTPGVAIEMYGEKALADGQGDNFTPLPSGIDFLVTIRNTTAVAFTVTGGIKGQVER